MQKFVEAKRHQPSVLYIPSLLEWSTHLAESTLAMFATLLDSLSTSEPVLVFAFVDGNVEDLPVGVRDWFGKTDDNEVGLTKPGNVTRCTYLFPD